MRPPPLASSVTSCTRRSAAAATATAATPAAPATAPATLSAFASAAAAARLPATGAPTAREITASGGALAALLAASPRIDWMPASATGQHVRALEYDADARLRMFLRASSALRSAHRVLPGVLTIASHPNEVAVRHREGVLVALASAGRALAVTRHWSEVELARLPHAYYDSGGLPLCRRGDAGWVSATPCA